MSRERETRCVHFSQTLVYPWPYLNYGVLQINCLQIMNLWSHPTYFRTIEVSRVNIAPEQRTSAGYILNIPPSRTHPLNSPTTGLEFIAFEWVVVSWVALLTQASADTDISIVFLNRYNSTRPLSQVRAHLTQYLNSIDRLELRTTLNTRCILIFHLVNVSSYDYLLHHASLWASDFFSDFGDGPCIFPSVLVVLLP